MIPAVQEHRTKIKCAHGLAVVQHINIARCSSDLVEAIHPRFCRIGLGIVGGGQPCHLFRLFDFSVLHRIGNGNTCGKAYPAELAVVDIALRHRRTKDTRCHVKNAGVSREIVAVEL